ncbi:hypothetical protein BAUCODRAFT_121514 [Baudoinia panamericana UAMH 10762]|uniref:HPP transmembrane region domain-containing protein n=1 Tax=Baudoinia panamericana (strain UAMH 10762) TaxID=717646 RepID=M2MJX4_BAUPA|nr:uncharacterized protein BAUCODRAFT_121514 [Baudoinia panamericana UAMH 10762]EMC96986.1 hypothetical protein BAUCODRAFT_121514 [Baudoinia panamericana UAMH 10762]
MENGILNELLNFDIDRILNPWVPHNCLYILPTWISRFLGYRHKPQKEPPCLVQWALTLVATIAGLCVVGATYTHAPGLTRHHPPALIASLGASAILDYNTMRSPLAQPRNTLIGHTLSAIIGVAISKLFQLNPSLFADYSWVAAAIACAISSVVMSATNTVHPPGGATAILASVDAPVVLMGWFFVPLVMVGSLLMLGVACLLNNTIRQYPIYWWTPADVGSKLRRAKAAAQQAQETPDSSQLEKQTSRTDSERTLQHEASEDGDAKDEQPSIRILSHKIELPKDLDLSPEEWNLLESLQTLLREESRSD